MRVLSARRTLGFVSVVCTAGFLLAGCQTDSSKEDASRSYFDGGALRAPEPKTIVLTGRVLSSRGRTEEAEFVLRRVVAEFP